MSDNLWTAEELARASGGQVSPGDWAVAGVSIDTRTLEPGDLFVALQDQRDGHEFLEQAAAKKAGAALIAVEGAAESFGLNSLTCDDTLVGLTALGGAARARVDAKIIAVTGSVGKTGTKESLKTAFGRNGKTHASAASYNNLWGVPLSLARMPRDSEFGIFEIGMNHADEIRPLTKLVRPHIAIITTVAPVHLEFFNSVDEIAAAKAEIFEGLEPGGIAIINRDIPHFDMLAGVARECGASEVIGFGESEKADARLTKFALHDACSCVTAEIGGERVTYGIGCPGKHWILNSLAVMAAVKAAGSDMALAAMALKQMTPPEGRGERMKIELRVGGDITLIDESYNANPASMRAALETLSGSTVQARGRRIAVIGDMRELGETSDDLHSAVGDLVDQLDIDRVFCCGPHMATLQGRVSKSKLAGYTESSTELVSMVTEEINPDDLVMVKGSLGTNMAPIVEAIQQLGKPAVAPGKV